ncbi:MAG TPA: cyclic nucleotide-binding domain-containing protein [Blastocatellia bacterium]|nr:cyclic nucleotide-binding domain-containing protein [Blastocatellia bacterium]
MTLGDVDVFATLPLATYQPGEFILTEGSKTGRLWILKKGAVAVARQGIEIAKVTEPGAVFGDISALLDTPHTADVRALEISVFHVVDAATSLQDPAVLVHVARVLAQRLNVANQTLVDLKTKPR